MKKFNIVIVGLGYVGLPLACHFALAGHYVKGFDIDNDKIDKLKQNVNIDNILNPKELLGLKEIEFINTLSGFRESQTIYIVTVPTPIDTSRTPDMGPLLNASERLGQVVESGDIVVYESTVYPGATRDQCIPLILRGSEKRGVSGIRYGYSPERVNPGDHERTLDQIIKIVSGSDPSTTSLLKELYDSIISVGTYITSSVEEAEAAKVTENIQRDVNIALMNELDIIFKRLGINTHNVIEAAATKWNFMKVTPGLVGGHCIGVDPYYMIHAAKCVNAFPALIESARQVNEGYLDFVISEFCKWIIKNKIDLSVERVLFLGVTFKADCADVRNSKNFEAYEELKKIIEHIDYYDPLLDNQIKFEPTVVIIGAMHRDWKEATQYLLDDNVIKYKLVK